MEYQEKVRPERLNEEEIYRIAKRVTTKAAKLYQKTVTPIPFFHNPQDFPPRRLRLTVTYEVIRELDCMMLKDEFTTLPDDIILTKIALGKLCRNIERERLLTLGSREAAKKLIDNRFGELVNIFDVVIVYYHLAFLETPSVPANKSLSKETLREKVVAPTKKSWSMVKDVKIDIGDNISVSIIKDQLVHTHTCMVEKERREFTWEQNISLIHNDIVAVTLLLGMTGEDLLTIGREVEKKRNAAERFCY